MYVIFKENNDSGDDDEDDGYDLTGESITIWAGDLIRSGWWC